MKTICTSHNVDIVLACICVI